MVDVRNANIATKGIPNNAGWTYRKKAANISWTNKRWWIICLFISVGGNQRWHQLNATNNNVMSASITSQNKTINWNKNAQCTKKKTTAVVARFATTIQTTIGTQQILSHNRMAQFAIHVHQTTSVVRWMRRHWPSGWPHHPDQARWWSVGVGQLTNDVPSMSQYKKRKGSAPVMTIETQSKSQTRGAVSNVPMHRTNNRHPRLFHTRAVLKM